MTKEKYINLKIAIAVSDVSSYWFKTFNFQIKYEHFNAVSIVAKYTDGFSFR